jgi:hypothetical protein
MFWPPPFWHRLVSAGPLMMTDRLASVPLFSHHPLSFLLVCPLRLCFCCDPCEKVIAMTNFNCVMREVAATSVVLEEKTPWFWWLWRHGEKANCVRRVVTTHEKIQSIKIQCNFIGIFWTIIHEKGYIQDYTVDTATLSIRGRSACNYVVPLSTITLRGLRRPDLWDSSSSCTLCQSVCRCTASPDIFE